jgi:phage terminase small subunit
MTGKLTAKQQRFVDEYLIDLNGTQAAIRAGYSQKTANEIAAENLAKPSIREVIDAALDRRSKETQIDANWVLKRLAAEAEADVNDLYDDTGAIKPMSEWPLIWRQGLVAGIEHIEVKDHEGNKTGDVVVKVKLSDRIRRLELIGKHVRVNAFQEIVQHKGLDNLADRLARAKKRSD